MSENVQVSAVLAKINAIIDKKVDNPEVLRTAPNRAIFVLNDESEMGHRHGIRVEITRYEDGKFLRFVEYFQDTTPRFKPSVLVYDYDFFPDEYALLAGPFNDMSDLARNRMEQLLSDVKPLAPIDDEELRYLPSKNHLKRVLDALKTMRILID